MIRCWRRKNAGMISVCVFFIYYIKLFYYETELRKYVAKVLSIHEKVNKETRVLKVIGKIKCSLLIFLFYDARSSNSLQIIL